MEEGIPWEVEALNALDQQEEQPINNNAMDKHKIDITFIRGELGWVVRGDTMEEAKTLATQASQFIKTMEVPFTEAESSRPVEPTYSPVQQPVAEEKPNLSEQPRCPKCGGAMWDNRDGKKNPKAPDFRCKDKTCLTKGFPTGVWL